ncbi:unnamed protein product [Porites evermanni]|uniref:Homeobox domain-containing protein n=1 Tax=Porites evermanni TaxID=104178 RepID=A0ABN8LVL7_9CNID|nr:unnamed protein product [Porites evermanni]
MASFRIEDILARPHGPASHSSGRSSESGSGIGVPTPIPSYQQLSFGVEQILSRHDNEQREPRLPLLGAYSVVPNTCDHLHATYWTSPYFTAHPQPFLCGSLLHPTCDTCHTHSPYSYSSISGIYRDYSATVLNKTIPGQVLPGQPKPRKPRRPWTRAVFSNLQRKGLEKRFQLQKYLTKADRHQLASMLGLSDNQVKVWFQNRRMKWRQDARETVASGSSEETTERSEQ